MDGATPARIPPHVPVPTVTDVPALSTLQGLLRNLFQTEEADLDFGIYRLLRLKRAEIEACVSDQLSRRVREAFEGSTDEERRRLRAELEVLAEQMREQIADDVLLHDGVVNPAHRDQKARVARDLMAKYDAKRAER